MSNNVNVVAEPTKAVIMAAGLGTRMRAASDDAQLTPEQRAVADTGVKAMITIDRPFLDYVLSALADAGFREVCLVIGAQPAHRLVREYYEGVSATRLHVSFAVQQKPLGTADALLAAADFVGLDAFLVLNSDNYYPVDVLRTLRQQREPAMAAFERATLLRESNIPEERVASFALLDVGEDGYLTRVVEKPDPQTARALASSPVSMNVWLFTPAIFEACRRVPVSSRGELELPKAVQWAIEHLDMRIRAVPVRAGVLDLSRRVDIPVVAERLRGVEVRL
jgi:dTDP-glucose pyrophosphorylase